MPEFPQLLEGRFALEHEAEFHGYQAGLLDWSVSERPLVMPAPQTREQQEAYYYFYTRGADKGKSCHKQHHSDAYQVRVGTSYEDCLRQEFCGRQEIGWMYDTAGVSCLTGERIGQGRVDRECRKWNDATFAESRWFFEGVLTLVMGNIDFFFLEVVEETGYLNQDGDWWCDSIDAASARCDEATTDLAGCRASLESSALIAVYCVRQGAHQDPVRAWDCAYNQGAPDRYWMEAGESINWFEVNWGLR